MSTNILFVADNWGEPERAPHKRYSCARIIYILLWYVGHAKYMACISSMDVNAKYCIAHSRAWATGRMYAVLIYRIAYLHSCYIVGSKEEIAMSRKTDVVVSSTARGASKKAIEINLLTHRDCTTTEAAAMRLHVLPDLAIKCWHLYDRIDSTWKGHRADTRQL